MVTDDVEVAIVDQGPVVLETELNVLPAVIHEDVDHGEVDVTRVGKLQAAYMQRLASGLQVTEVLIVILSRVKVTLKWQFIQNTSSLVYGISVFPCIGYKDCRKGSLIHLLVIRFLFICCIVNRRSQLSPPASYRYRMMAENV